MKHTDKTNCRVKALVNFLSVLQSPDEVIAAVLKVSDIQFSDSEDDIEEDFAATSSEKDERAIQSVP